MGYTKPYINLINIENISRKVFTETLEIRFVRTARNN